MNPLKFLKTALTLVVVCFAGLALAQNDDHKVLVCHYPPGNPDNPHTIEIDASAWDAHHANHPLDVLGACSDNNNNNNSNDNGNSNNNDNSNGNDNSNSNDNTSSNNNNSNDNNSNSNDNTSNNNNNAERFVVICHYPPGNPSNPQTITISENAWPGHSANHPLDQLGPCPSNNNNNTSNNNNNSGNNNNNNGGNNNNNAGNNNNNSGNNNNNSGNNNNNGGNNNNNNGCGASCNDQDPCTRDWCSQGQCMHAPVNSPECGGIVTDSSCIGVNCNDQDPCTRDWCNDGACLHGPVNSSRCGGNNNNNTSNNNNNNTSNNNNSSGNNNNNTSNNNNNSGNNNNNNGGNNNNSNGNSNGNGNNNGNSNNNNNSGNNNNNTQNFLEVCHHPPGNPSNAHTITIPESAWEAHHANHPLDELGACSNDNSNDNDNNNNGNSNDNGNNNSNDNDNNGNDNNSNDNGNSNSNNNNNGTDPRTPAKVLVCHYPPGNPDNPNEIWIAESAWPAHHANHPDDVLGPCPGNDNNSNGNSNDNNNSQKRSLDDSNSELVNISPNPAHGEFQITVNLEVASKLKVRVFSATGQLVFEESKASFSGSYTKHVNVSAYSTGIYFVAVDVDGEVTIKKILSSRN